MSQVADRNEGNAPRGVPTTSGLSNRPYLSPRSVTEGRGEKRNEPEERTAFLAFNKKARSRSDFVCMPCKNALKNGETQTLDGAGYFFATKEALQSHMMATHTAVLCEPNVDITRLKAAMPKPPILTLPPKQPNSRFPTEKQHYIRANGHINERPSNEQTGNRSENRQPNLDIIICAKNRQINSAEFNEKLLSLLCKLKLGFQRIQASAVKDELVLTCLNLADLSILEKELKNHPFLSYRNSNSIVFYFTMPGELSSEDELASEIKKRNKFPKESFKLSMSIVPRVIPFTKVLMYVFGSTCQTILDNNFKLNAYSSTLTMSYAHKCRRCDKFHHTEKECSAEGGVVGDKPPPLANQADQRSRAF